MMISTNHYSTKELAIKLRNEYPEMTITEIGNECGVTRQRIQQILSEANLPTKHLPNITVCLNCHKVTFNQKYCSKKCLREYEHNLGLLASRFMQEVIIGESCWIWKGNTDPNGYGRTCYHGHREYAHRISFLIFNGEIPPGLFILHRCDNPPCVNPEHLLAGTQKENILDSELKGRRVHLAGDDAPTAILRSTQIPIIRERLKTGETCRSIGNDYGVSFQTIQAVKGGRSWKNY